MILDLSKTVWSFLTSGKISFNRKCLTYFRVGRGGVSHVSRLCKPLTYTLNQFLCDCIVELKRTFFG